MKKLLLLITVTVFATNFIYAQNVWVTHKADDRLSVKFPVEPKEIIAGTFMATTPDSSTIFILTVVDFKNFGVDSATLASIKTTPQFMEQMLGGLKKSLPDVDLENLKPVTYKGLTSYTTTGSDSKRKKYDMFLLLIGSKMYSISTIRSYGTDTKNRDYYWSTIDITAK